MNGIGPGILLAYISQPLRFVGAPGGPACGPVGREGGPQGPLIPVFQIRIRMDPYKDMPPGSGSSWTDADPDPGGKKA